MSDPAQTVINTPPSPPPATPHADERNINYSGEPVTQVAFDMRMEVVNSRMDGMSSRLESTNLLMIGVLIVLAICFLTLFYGYWQFDSTSRDGYAQKSKELNDDRYNLLKDRLDFLESKIATQSAQ